MTKTEEDSWDDALSMIEDGIRRIIRDADEDLGATASQIKDLCSNLIDEAMHEVETAGTQQLAAWDTLKTPTKVRKEKRKREDTDGEHQSGKKAKKTG